MYVFRLCFALVPKLFFALGRYMVCLRRSQCKVSGFPVEAIMPACGNAFGGLSS